MSNLRQQDIERINKNYGKVRDLRTLLSLGEEYDWIQPVMHFDEDGLHEKISEEIAATCQMIFDDLDDMGFFPIFEKGGDV